MKSAETSTSSAWLLPGFAVALETAGAIGLRFSEGFTLFLPTLIALTAFALALYIVSQVMKKLPVSVAYPVWAGGGTAGVALVGILMLKERAGIWKGVGIILVVIGIVVLNAASGGRGS